MAKKSKRKKNKKLRRQVEILRAQLKSNAGPTYETNRTKIQNESKKNTDSKFKNSELDEIKGIHVDPKLIKKDLLKTLVLSAVAFAIILALHFNS